MDDVDQDRAIRRVGFSVGWWVRQIFGQHTGRGVDRGQNVLRGAVDVPFEIELHRNRRGADPAGRSHFRQPRDGRELLFERRRDSGCHRLRARAGVVDRYHDGREIDLRQRRHRKEAIGANPEYEHAQHHQRGRDRPANKGFRNAHKRSLSNGDWLKYFVIAAQPVCGAERFIRAPLVRRYCPSTTTCSPGERPFATTATPSCVATTSTTLRSTVSSGLIT